MPVEPQPPAARRLLSEPPHWRAATLDAAHGFFGRRGGVSEGIYASLNAGPGSNDAREPIAENRRRIAAAFGQSTDKLVRVHQVHSATVFNVDAPFPEPAPHGDGLVTTTPGVILSVLAADCAPVLFADARAGVVGAAHAGWKGAIGGVLEATVQAMRGAGATHIAAAIGPCIHQASYEVGPEFEQRFIDADASYARFFAPGSGDRRRFDLPGFCAARLASVGVTAEILPLDTYPAAANFFSHRRSVHAGEPDYGRNCAAIRL